ncbi:MAG: ABC transporter ATP-binding protein [Muribaculaceae bacterium]|nr:ABC transporter ATP-binding protein [Muribaculaceae bacterium]
MIELRGFSMGYDASRTLLRDVNATFAAGRLTALIGRNGSGKSTLLRAMAALPGATCSGRIIVDGRDIGRAPRHTLARTIAFVATGRTRIPCMRCADVVAMGRAPYTNWMGSMQPVDRDIVFASLEAVGMAEYAGRDMNTMSDGECQRIMIARALAQDTPVMLLDEPTSFLDLPNRHELCALLARLAHDSGKCIVFSTHELDIALRRADDIALIAPPQLNLLDAPAMQHSGLIESTFHLEQL